MKCQNHYQLTDSESKIIINHTKIKSIYLKNMYKTGLVHKICEVIWFKLIYFVNVKLKQLKP
jgi:hypothetical protein